MPASEARIAADRAQALKLIGAKTAGGKTGRGDVSADDDSAEVARRSAAMLVEMAPRTEMGRFLVDRLAERTVCVQRSAYQQRAAIAFLALHAGSAFDQARLAVIDHALTWIRRAEPATHSWTLRRMPEGVDRIIALLLDLREELNTGRWDWSYGEKVSNLTGTAYMEVPVTRAHALSEAIVGRFQSLNPVDGEGLSPAARIDWARQAMADLIDAEIDKLLEHRKTLDLEGIEADRASAASRSAFDPSKAAILARRHEAAAERGIYRALNELQRVEARAAMVKAPEGPDPDEPPLGSFSAEAVEPAAPPSRSAFPSAPSGPGARFGRSERAGRGPKVAGKGGRGPA